MSNGAASPELAFFGSLSDYVSSPIGALLDSGIWGVFGYVSPAHREEIIQQEANDLIRASGGIYSYDYASTIAERDVSGALTQAGADPSQAPAFLQNFGQYINYALIALVVLLALKLIFWVRG